MIHKVSLKAFVYRYIGSASAIEDDPSYALFTYEIENSDWVLVKEVLVETTHEADKDEMIRSAVARIDEAIHQKRMYLEYDLKDLNSRKQDLLSLTYEKPTK